ncbi:hypothetical protein [Novipirellula sp.]|uniref:hypothetical protein n=1 Tax=Novipirellula sp. TaxID=2795430 RepID=UPI0035694096
MTAVTTLAAFTLRFMTVASKAQKCGPNAIDFGPIRVLALHSEHAPDQKTRKRPFFG